MTSGLNGLEVSVGMVVRFWCVPLALFVRGYVAHVAGGKKVDISRQSARQLRRRLGIA